MSPADELVRREIAARGPIPFSEFMALALYHPEQGYYSRVEPGQDYYTSADVHPMFAEILGRFLLWEWDRNFRDEDEFAVVEPGCGRGRLARALLDWAAESVPSFYRKLRYVGIETSVLRRSASAEANAAHRERAEFRPDFDFADGSLRGAVLSNEFFDALPFRRVRNDGGRLREIFVDADLKEIELDPAPETRDYFRWLGQKPAEGCKGEAHLACREWMRRIGRSLAPGSAVVTVDYGYLAGELYADLRPEGTALCHFRHGTNREFYRRVGEQDITAHVNFTALIEEGKAWKLKPQPLQTQSSFLLDHGLGSLVESVNKAADPRERLKASAAARSLIHPEGMGGTFKVLVQRKD